MDGTVIDLHVHTTAGSADSAIKPHLLAARAGAAGLDALTVTEHFRAWDPFDASQLQMETGLRLLRGIEWNTDIGHVLVYGLDRYDAQVRSAAKLRELVTASAGFMVLAHPFRHFFDPPKARRWLVGEGPSTMSAEECAALPAFRLVDEIEIFNGNCTPRENAFAAEVAVVLGMRGTGGSDAHYLEDLGRCRTIFERQVLSTQELIGELRSGRFRAVGPPPDANAY